MAQEIYRANTLKWLLHNLKLPVIYGIIAAGLWWTYDSTHDESFLVTAILISLLGVVTFVAGLFNIPKIVISDTGLKTGKSQFDFADVVDVNHHKEEYTFFLASRRRVTFKLDDYSAQDKKSIDNIVAGRCLEHLASDRVKEKIAGAANTDNLEFSYTAKRTNVFFALYFLILIFGLFSLFACIIFFTLGEPGDSTPVLLSVVTAVLLGLGVWAYFIEKKAVKDVFSYRGDIFTLTNKDKVKFSFARDEVQGVGINPDGQAYIVFRIKNRKQKIRLLLTPYSRRNCREMKGKIRSIFFLPEPAKKGFALMNPLKV